MRSSGLPTNLFQPRLTDRPAEQISPPWVADPLAGSTVATPGRAVDVLLADPDSMFARNLEPVYRFDPLSDSRWNAFVWNHPQSSVFHSSAWLEALRRTYGYQAVVFTTSRPEERLRNAALFCRVDSWLTGRRLVSLPFCDHCELLAEDEGDVDSIYGALATESHHDHLSYVELRSINGAPPARYGVHSTVDYVLHRLDLGPSLESLFANLHRSSTQRKICRSVRERLNYQEGRSDALLDAFSRLWVITRRRHLAPPQPIKWFRNLIDCFGDALKIRVAYKDSQPVAAIITLEHKQTLVYKYGCSDVRSNNLGGVHLLLWRSIEEAKQKGLRVFDFGRSAVSNRGLVTFKDRWGTSRSVLSYSRSFESRESTLSHVCSKNELERQIARWISVYLPEGLFRLAGSMMYRHVG